MSDTKSDAYERAERITKLAERAFPGIDRPPLNPLRPPVAPAETRPARPVLPPAALEVAALAREIVFDVEEPAAPARSEVAPVRPPAAPAPAAVDEILSGEVVGADVLADPRRGRALAAPSSIVERAAGSYLDGIDATIEADRDVDHLASAAVAGVGVFAALVGAGITAAAERREAEAAAAEEARRGELAALDARIRHLSGRVDRAQDAALRGAQIAAEQGIAAQRTVAALVDAQTLDRRIAHEERAAERERHELERDKWREEWRAARRRAARLEERAERAEVEAHNARALAPRSGGSSAAVADAIDRVLAATDGE